MKRTRSEHMGKPNRTMDLYKQKRYDDILTEYYPSVQHMVDKYDDEDIKRDVLLYAWEFIVTKGEDYAYGYEFPMRMYSYVNNKIRTKMRHNNIDTISLDTQEGRHEVYNVSLLEEDLFSDIEYKEVFKLLYNKTLEKYELRPRDFIILSAIFRYRDMPISTVLAILSKKCGCSKQALEQRFSRLRVIFFRSMRSWDRNDLFN